MRTLGFGWVVAVAALAACGGDREPASDQVAADSGSPAMVTAAGVPADSSAQAMGEDSGSATGMLVPLQAVGGSGASGTATVYGDPEGGEQASVAVSLTGAPASESLPAHVHRGRCGSDQGVAMPLGAVGTVEDGSGDSSTSVTVSLLTSGDLYVQVHGPDGAPILCGDIPRGG